MKVLLRLTVGALILLLSACGDPPAPVDSGLAEVEARASADDSDVYRFDIGGREFEPGPGLAPGFSRQVKQRIAERQAQFSGAPNQTYLLVQFHQPLDRATRQRFDENGVMILERITTHTWIANADAQSAESLLSDPAVRWADVYPEGVKRASSTHRREPYDWQVTPDGRAAYSVLFHRDVQRDEVEALEQIIPKLTLRDLNQADFELYHSTVVVVDPQNLDELAKIQAVRWIEPDQPPAINLNLDHAQPTSNVDAVQQAPYNLSGRGITVGIWEVDGLIDTTPLDFDDRVIAQANQISGCANHPVHVAGTVGASGATIPAATGMAPQVTIASWDSISDSSELNKAGNSPGGPGNPTPIAASNHSYGEPIGWNNDGSSFIDNQETFGQYNGWTQRFDVAVGNTDLIISIAAGNDRNDRPAGSGTGQPPADCRQGGMNIAADCIGAVASAKNVITVGAVDGTGSITSFSSFGPTNDGRIKPDLMAYGGSTRSLACNCAADLNGDGLEDNICLSEASTDMAGTSMATAVVTGVVALLLEQAEELKIVMTAAGMRAVLIQTARDLAGIGQSHEGPDFASGWGIVDARAAADLLRHAPGSRLLHQTLDDTGPEHAWNGTFTVPDGLSELRVTLAWTDLEGNVKDAAGNAELHNDLDLRLIAPDKEVFQPWSLDHDNPAIAAIRNGGDDARNNVEQVSVLEPKPGIWTLQVTAKPGSLSFGSQRFALAGSVALDS